MEDEFKINWKEHTRNLKCSFSNRLEEGTLTDVTFICKDGKALRAHKLVLAVSSPFFSNLFSTTSACCQNLLFIVKHVESQTMQALLTFIYTGEVTVHKEVMRQIFMLAKEFEIKGLSESILNDSALTVEQYPPKVIEKYNSTKRERSLSPPNNVANRSHDDHNLSDSVGPSRQPSYSPPEAAIGPDFHNRSNPFCPSDIVGSMVFGSQPASPVPPMAITGLAQMAALNNQSNFLRSLKQFLPSPSLPPVTGPSHLPVTGPSHLPVTPFSSAFENSLTNGFMPMKREEPSDEELRSPDSERRTTPCHFFPRGESPRGSPFHTSARISSTSNRYKQYSKEDLSNAIAAATKGCSASTAAKQYNVPPRTLYDKIKKLKAVGKNGTRNSRIVPTEKSPQSNDDLSDPQEALSAGPSNIFHTTASGASVPDKMARSPPEPRTTMGAFAVVQQNVFKSLREPKIEAESTPVDLTSHNPLLSRPVGEKA